MSERPHGRKRHNEGVTSEVHRRESGGSVFRSPVVTRGGPLSILIIIALLLFGGGGSGTDSYEYQQQPQSPAVSQSSGNYGSATTNNVTYTNGTSQQVNTAVANGARDKYTKLLGNGKDTVTVMYYMCGTDLESQYGMATADLNEMAYATHSDNVNIIVETGGTKRWKNTIVSSNTNQIWKVGDRSLQKLEGNLGRKPMTDPATLSEFIQYCAKNYPANRYILIMWDHGGGSLTGYGYDEIYPNGSMTVDKIAEGLKGGGVKFDIVGFDACLMANMETASAVEPYADYLLASEEVEPGTGWYHVDWLTQLAENSSVSSLELGKTAIDSFCTVKQSRYSSASEQYTLSIIDLAEFAATVPDKLSALSKTISSGIQNNNYQNVSDARSVTREFAADQQIDQIDMINFCDTMNTAEAKELASALRSCVKYNRTSNITNAYGVSVYFPYRNVKRVNYMVQIYDTTEFNSDYSDAVKSFATVEASGQAASNYSSNSLFDLLMGSSSSNGESYTIDLSSLFGRNLSTSAGSTDVSVILGGSDAVDEAALETAASQIANKSFIGSDRLVFSEKNGKTVLSLTQEEWAQVQDIKLIVWVKDGDGYFDLGKDNIFEFDNDGNLIIEYDDQWVAVNDQIVSYKMLSCEPAGDGTWITRGYIPCLINGQKANLLVEFSGEDETGFIVGAQLFNDVETDGRVVPYIDDAAALYDEDTVCLKGDDVIDFTCDFYDLNGNYQDNYLIGTSVTVKDGLKITDVYVKAEKILYGYELTDIYGSARRTPISEY